MIMEPLSAKNKPGSGQWTETITHAANRYDGVFRQALRQFSNPETARQRAAFTRWKAIENLDKYLIEFESNFIRAGGKVLWAQDITDALESIRQILSKSDNHKVVKSKSSTIEEIGLYNALKADGYTLSDTDTGDFVMNKQEETNAHMVLPALHKSSAEIASEFRAAFSLDTGDNPQALVQFVRKQMRDEFTAAGAGITGCNFLVADPGAVVITENEGNAALSAGMPPVHIVIAGIEKVLPSLTDLELFLPLLSTYGTGQTLAAYNHILSGPKQTEEQDGPSEMYVILLDNGRSDVLQHEPQRQAMSCIRCGACQYACPVYRAAGPEIFPSPVYAVIRPLKSKDENVRQLSYSSTLCGSCKDVCPVNIDLPNLLVHNRKLFADQGEVSRGEKVFYFLWKKAMLKREIMNWKGIRAGKHLVEKIYRSPQGLRVMPKAVQKSFNEQWREKMMIR